MCLCVCVYPSEAEELGPITLEANAAALVADAAGRQLENLKSLVQTQEQVIRRAHGSFSPSFLSLLSPFSFSTTELVLFSFLC